MHEDQVSRTTRINLQVLANPAWAFSELSIRDQALLQSLSEAAIRRFQVGRLGSEALDWELADFGILKASNALVLAAAELSMSAEPLLAAAEAALSQISRVLDATGPTSQLPGLLAVQCSASATQEEKECKPCLLLDRPDVYVLWKPSCWAVQVHQQEVNAERERRDTGACRRRILWEWLRYSLGPHCPIARNAEVEHGLVHRLDTDTSGALLCGKTYRGYFLARLQFAARRVLKLYICLCHNFLDVQPRCLQAPLQRARRKDGLWATRVSAEGRHASTELLGVCHLLGQQLG